MQSPCLTRAPTVALRPFHSRTSGLFSAEEPAISSIIAPSAKISPALMMHLSVAFDSLLALGLALVLKAICSLRGGSARKVHPINQLSHKLQICITCGLLVSCATGIA